MVENRYLCPSPNWRICLLGCYCVLPNLRGLLSDDIAIVLLGCDLSRVFLKNLGLYTVLCIQQPHIYMVSKRSKEQNLRVNISNIILPSNSLLVHLILGNLLGLCEFARALHDPMN